MQSKAKTPGQYVEELPLERKAAITKVRQVILDNLPPGYQESVGAGMLMYGVPLSRFPNTYNGHPLCYVALASQKNYMAVYLMTVYGDKKTEAVVPLRVQGPRQEARHGEVVRAVQDARRSAARRHW